MATELINRYAEQIDSINLHGGVGGAFEVSIDGEQVYSKLAIKRYPDLSEIVGAVEKKLG
jgi:selT/selW/selH-like putative selenoprotein